MVHFFSLLFLFFFSFFRILLSSFWTSRGHRSQVSTLFPAGSCLQFLSPIGFSNPTAHRFFIERFANSRSRAFCQSNCAQEKVPTNLYGYALGRTRTHKTDLYHCVVACDHRADLSRVKNQYGHWVCWMSTSRRTV